MVSGLGPRMIFHGKHTPAQHRLHMGAVSEWFRTSEWPVILELHAIWIMCGPSLQADPRCITGNLCVLTKLVAKLQASSCCCFLNVLTSGIRYFSTLMRLWIKYRPHAGCFLYGFDVFSSLNKLCLLPPCDIVVCAKRSHYHWGTSP